MMASTDADFELTAEVLQFVRSQSAAGRIRAMILDLVNQALRAQRVALPNAEKEALAQAVLREILQEMLAAPEV